MMLLIKKDSKQFDLTEPLNSLSFQIANHSFSIEFLTFFWINILIELTRKLIPKVLGLETVA